MLLRVYYVGFRICAADLTRGKEMTLFTPGGERGAVGGWQGAQ